MSDFLEILKFLNGCTPWVYTLVFFTGVLYFRMLSSFTISAVIMGFFKFTEITITTPLLEFFVNEGNNGIEQGKIVWVSIGMTFNILIIAMIKLAHERLNLAKSIDTKVIEWCIAFISALLILEYVSSITYDSTKIARFYELSIPTINVLAGIFIIFSLMRNIFNVNITVAYRRRPRS